jgi:hypothetical protein
LFEPDKKIPAPPAPIWPGRIERKGHFRLNARERKSDRNLLEMKGESQKLAFLANGFWRSFCREGEERRKL